ncbi:MAG: hypothetical protein ACE5GB_00400 [Acidimicrobiales bacterium]
MSDLPTRNHLDEALRQAVDDLAEQVAGAPEPDELLGPALRRTRVVRGRQHALIAIAAVATLIAFVGGVLALTGDDPEPAADEVVLVTAEIQSRALSRNATPASAEELDLASRFFTQLFSADDDVLLGLVAPELLDEIRPDIAFHSLLNGEFSDWNCGVQSDERLRCEVDLDNDVNRGWGPPVRANFLFTITDGKITGLDIEGPPVEGEGIFHAAAAHFATIESKYEGHDLFAECLPNPDGEFCAEVYGAERAGIAAYYLEHMQPKRDSIDLLVAHVNGDPARVLDVLDPSATVDFRPDPSGSPILGGLDVASVASAFVDALTKWADDHLIVDHRCNVRGPDFPTTCEISIRTDEGEKELGEWEIRFRGDAITELFWTSLDAG